MEDISVRSTNALGAVTAQKKPPYLITLLTTGKNPKRFISLDRPDILGSVIQTKGYFIDNGVKDIKKCYLKHLSNVDLSEMVDMIFPIHMVESMQNLAFNAVKTRQ